MVDHELLLEKLKIYGVENNAINWFKSYLVNRHQFVSISGKTSGMAFMKHGVLQGSILGPLLFIVYTNDLPLHVSSSIDLYADDTTVTASVEYNSIPYLQVSLNKSVNEIAQWETSNKLPLNANKTKFLLVTRKHLASKIKGYPNKMLDGIPLKIVTTIMSLIMFLSAPKTQQLRFYYSLVTCTFVSRGRFM